MTLLSIFLKVNQLEVYENERIYVFLVPCVRLETIMNDTSLQYNPLLIFKDPPPLHLIQPQHITPALDQLLHHAQQVVAQVCQSPEVSWDTLIAPLDDMLDQLNTAWGQVSHLHAVVNTPELHEAYNHNLARISTFYTELGQNAPLYKQYKKLQTSLSFNKLSQAQRKVIDNALRDFRLSGAELNDKDKTRFKAISEALSTLSATFSQNLLEATDHFSLYIEDAATLQGLPEDVLQAFAKAAQDDKRRAYKITLHMPSYLPVMQYADNRALREQLYYAYATRASEFGPAEQNNGPIIEQILTLKKEAATLLGFEHYAAESLATKMAHHTDEVLVFLRDLATRAKPYALQDRADLEAFAHTELGLDKLEAWDIAYVTAKLQQARYAFSDQEVKQYFTEPKVLAGLFTLVKTLYGITIAESEAPTWHPSVKFFELYNKNHQRIGEFYLDTYARAQKRGGAWMADARNRYRKQDGQLQLPAVYLTCNFASPVADKPALLTHDDVLTLFHEFGHGLHHLLTEIEVAGVSGISGVEWDAVELPSQFMENFCWEWEVIQNLSGHVNTDKPLPRELFDKMLAAKNFQSGMSTVRQVEFALFDLLIHSQPIYTMTQVEETLQAVRAEVAVNFPPAYHRFAHSFAHIFGGGYAAGYYSYKWAEVLSSDAYAYFEENGILSPEVGEKFRKEILSVGGSRPALDSFKAFRGRAPTIDALLRHAGMHHN
jgi:oligopeptidase A